MLKVRNAGSKTVTDAHLLKSQSLCEAMTPSFLFLSKLITTPSSKFDAEEISYPSDASPSRDFRRGQQLPLRISCLRGGVRLLLDRLVHVCSESCVETVAQKSEQLLGRTESNFLVGINFLHPSFEQALKWFCFRSQSNYESSSHLISEDLPLGDPSTLDLISALARRREADQ